MIKLTQLLKEIKVNQPIYYRNLSRAEALYEFFKNDQDIFKDSKIYLVISQNARQIVDNIWDNYSDSRQEIDIESYNDGSTKDYPKTKKDLLDPDKQTMSSDDAEYLEVNEFIFPYILKHLKENGWEHIGDIDFSKDGREVDIFNYIKPFGDSDSDPREILDEKFYEYIMQNY
jgi:hypothetical protein